MSDQEKSYRMLVINPGSTSTKISLFINERHCFERSVFHDAPVLLQYPHVNGQVPFRYQVILDILKSEGVDPASIDVFIGRGGSACSQPSGVTIIDQKLFDDTRDAVGGSEHASKLGVMLAWEFVKNYGKPAYTLNPTNIDEYSDLARLTGIKGLYRVARSHALNQKAVAEHHAGTLGKRYEDCNLIVAHIDGGITIGAHAHGRMVDGTMGADGEGPFAPTRIGHVPVLELLEIGALTGQLGKVGSNINQIARRANATGNVYQEDIEEIKGVLNEIWRLQRLSLLNQPAEEDIYLQTLAAAHVDEDEYFSHRVHADIDTIIKDLRADHMKDAATAPEATAAEEIKKEFDAAATFTGSDQERQTRIFCMQLGINYDRLTPDEFTSLVSILKKSKLLKSPLSKRGRNSIKKRKR